MPRKTKIAKSPSKPDACERFAHYHDVLFRGKTYTVAKCYTERGNRDDDTIWMNLGDVQNLVDKKGRINAILGRYNPRGGKHATPGGDPRRRRRYGFLARGYF